MSTPPVIITDHALADRPIESLDEYVAAGGLVGLTTARGRAPADVIEQVGAAGIRGRGGAGFPAGRKWRSIAESTTPADQGFVVVNAAEGEPGTFKDRSLLRVNPWIVLEGALIAAHCIGSNRLVVATKAIYLRELERLRDAAVELSAAGATGDVTIEIVEGPDHYLFGEETAMLEVIEGEDPLPRHIPPYLYGLFSTAPNLGWSAGRDESPGGPTQPSDNPALVNNAETYAHAALVCRNGVEWYRSMGTDESPGPTIVTITGDVQRAAVVEVELGQPLIDVVEAVSGGPRTGRTIKAILSGVSNPVLLPENFGAAISYESLASAGGGLGSAGFIVFDDQRNMVDVAYQVSRFLHVESCGQCNPCKTGTHAITAALEGIVAGRATADHIATIERRLTTVTDASRCYLPTQEQRVITSLLQAYPGDLEERLAGVPGDFGVPLPKLVEVADGVATIDPDMSRKRPDWTYAGTPVWLNN